jgi:hypothetical protein
VMSPHYSAESTPTSQAHMQQGNKMDREQVAGDDDGVRNRTLTLIEREDDTRSWGNFLVYFSHSTTMPCPPRG